MSYVPHDIKIEYFSDPSDYGRYSKMMGIVSDDGWLIYHVEWVNKDNLSFGIVEYAKSHLIPRSSEKIFMEPSLIPRDAPPMIGEIAYVEYRGISFPIIYLDSGWLCIQSPAVIDHSKIIRDDV